VADNTPYGAGTYNSGVYQPFAVFPDSLNDPQTHATATATWSATVSPGSVADAATVNSPSAAVAFTATPGSAADADSLAAPSVSTAMTATPASLADPGTLGGPANAAAGQSVPDGIGHSETFGDPGAALAMTTQPGQTSTTETLGSPSVAFTAVTAPDSLTNSGGLGSPAIIDNTSAINYGTGLYGKGIYIGLNTSPDQTSQPDSIADPHTVGTAPATDFINNVNPNYGYGDGPYGVGTYFGAAPPPPHGAIPLFDAITAPQTRTPQHIIGIGPWSIKTRWRGAPNIKVSAGYYIPRPIIGLPPAVRKSFTLRLNEGSEGQAEFSFPRNSAVIPQEMATDVWWRRRDPTTGLVEVIGRFNISATDVSNNDTAVSINCQLVDYRTLLGDRMVLRYLDAVHSENLWAKSTPVVDILRWAVPTNMGLDLSILDGSDPAGLGLINRPFEIALGATMNEVFDNLNAISPRHWEWWVEMPPDSTRAPKLSATIGTRGADRGVVLVDVGGPTPITTWSMTNSADRYANSLYFIGGDGGDVVQDAAQIAEYGQRDVSDSDSSVKGTIDKVTHLPVLLDAAANKRLTQLADRRPTWTIVLKEGFWRGRSHIDIGDTVGVAISIGADRFTGKWRVTELNVDIDDMGTETVTLTLGTPLTSGNPYSRRSAVARIVARLKNYERKDTSS
jgi:hypothetical protein